MPRRYDEDVPGDVAGEDAQNLPGGFGVYNPDLDPNAVIDEIVGNDVMSPQNEVVARIESHGGTTAGTSYAEGVDTGSTVDPEVLVEGEESHPGAGVGFTGAESDKRISRCETNREVRPRSQRKAA